ncbi:ADP-ribosylation factor GTPase-activating protein [Pycnococcus provasolii]
MMAQTTAAPGGYYFSHASVAAFAGLPKAHSMPAVNVNQQDPLSPRSAQCTEIEQLTAEPANRRCADCTAATSPPWASVSFGVFLCIGCAGIHRSLGVHVSKVRSLTLDHLTEGELSALRRGGNEKGNAFFEACLPEDFQRPVPTDRTRLVTFIRAKYVSKAFVTRNTRTLTPGHARRSERVGDGDNSSTEGGSGRVSARDAKITPFAFSWDGDETASSASNDDDASATDKKMAAPSAHRTPQRTSTPFAESGGVLLTMLASDGATLEPPRGEPSPSWSRGQCGETKYPYLFGGGAKPPDVLFSRQGLCGVDVLSTLYHCIGMEVESHPKA